ncbi:tryptophan synthase subunit alpha [Asticcacaulis sp. YBE204]|uniref:tryptophan synthase subunit alpha n=1 Tax=Asticcacaulis sp. YBE204 TaxID=1282363 RepID=UPI0003C3C472|nr:tryptophan synthase subunit alpha [Asticcacaulis sp. YBE204]ESQ80832.1 tryptophan synthase subunit alpha [Asticcacaulis sp. YBE204]
MTVARIDARFAKLKAENKAAFVSYIMAGDPDLETSFNVLKGLAEAGSDIIELGFPFSDPMAEGPIIQLAAERSLKAGTKIAQVFALASRFREIDADTPLILMGYMNPVENMGYPAFARACADHGIDGVIVVDCPPEEAEGLTDALDAADVALIRLITPTSDEKRLKTLVKRTKGFVYYVSVAGVTGVKEADAQGIAGAVKRVQEAAQLPVVVGFGIKTPERASEVARIADGAVVGSVLVDALAKSLPGNSPIEAKVLETAGILAQAVHNARN